MSRMICGVRCVFQMVLGLLGIMDVIGVQKMIDVFFVVNGVKHTIRAISLHTALLKLGVDLENEGWTLTKFKNGKLNITAYERS